MSQFTYEYESQDTELETYEWDNVWWEQTGRNDAARVLYIGDSISCATRGFGTACSNGNILFDGFGTSKALDNPFLYDSIRIFAKQQKSCDAVLFNNGLHGWHLDDEVQYAHYYEKAVKFLLEEFKNCPVLIVLTTSVANEETEQRVKRRNEVAVKIAAKYGLPIVDLYSVSVECSSFRAEDGVHFYPDGCTKFAEQILRDLKKVIDRSVS